MTQTVKFIGMSSKLRNGTAAGVATAAAGLTFDEAAIALGSAVLQDYGYVAEQADLIASLGYSGAVIALMAAANIISGWLTSEPAGRISVE